MNYNIDLQKNQLEDFNFLKIPNSLEGFVNSKTIIEHKNNIDYLVFYGYVILSEEDLICSCCGGKMHIHNSYDICIKHLPFGETLSYILVKKNQLKCAVCGKTKIQNIPFQADGHSITKQLKQYIEDLLKTSNFTNKEVSYLTGVNRNLIKEIDKDRLMKLYTVDGKGEVLSKPEKQAKFLGIDEFKLHDGYKYATHIIDLETGHILWIAKGKKKQVVYDFIDYVGIEWMSNVIAVACDMNSDFEEAFKDKCPHIKIVYDHFHIVKNFNEKVIGAIRKEEQARLEKEGDKEAARKLKKTKFILTSSLNTLDKKDKESNENKILNKGSELFKIDEVTRKGVYTERYINLINSNEIFLTLEIIKELISEAYSCNDEDEMAKLIFDIMWICEENGNKHLLWFKNLLYKHFDGIITHATYKISSGKIEGINNKIKTLRRQSYGLPDDEYFFLKLLDMSRN